MLLVKVLKVGKPFSVKTQYGPKDKVNVICLEQSTKTEYDTTMFVPKDGIFFKEGDEIMADIEVNGQYVNLKKAEKKELPPQPPAKVENKAVSASNSATSNGLSKEEWAEKEKRDFRCRLVAQVLSTFPQKDRTEEELLALYDLVAVAVNSRAIHIVYDETWTNAK
jgi:hypothetical protein